MDFKDSVKLLLECLLSNKDCKQLSYEEWALVIVTAIVIIIAVIAFINKMTRALVNSRRQLKLKEDLHPFYSESEIKLSVKNYIITKGQNVAPSRENEPRDTHAFAIRENLIDKFVEDVFHQKEDNRFYIVLADSGMGKTTFIINLYLQYLRKRSFKRKYDIKLFPLGYPSVIEEINKVEQKNNTILFLDALDEDQEAVKDYKSRLVDVIAACKNFRVVVMTCRTQFFPNEQEENIETGIMKFGTEKGYHIFRKIYVSPFDEFDVKKYLDKKYGRFNPWLWKVKSRAKLIIKQSPNLMVRPMLLSYIDDLTKEQIKYRYTYQIYEKLIERWVDREAKRVHHKRYEIYKEDLYLFSQRIALLIYNNRAHNNALSINIDDIKPLAKQFGIRLEEWELTGRSLLNRDALGRYKFAHKSILEYFIAFNIYKSHVKDMDFIGFDMAKFFISELTHHKLIGVTGQYACIKNNYFRKNTNKQFEAIFPLMNINKREKKEKDIDYILLSDKAKAQRNTINIASYFTDILKDYEQSFDNEETPQYKFLSSDLLRDINSTYSLFKSKDIPLNLVISNHADRDTEEMNYNLSSYYSIVGYLNDLPLDLVEHITGLEIYISEETNSNFDFNVLSHLKNLSYLIVSITKHSDINFLNNLTNLKALTIRMKDRIDTLDSLCDLKIEFLHIICYEITIPLLLEIKNISSLKLLILDASLVDIKSLDLLKQEMPDVCVINTNRFNK